MRNQLLYTTAFLFFIAVCHLSCKKKSETPNDCTGGGITQPNYYLFWAKTDLACGPVTVEVKTSSGQLVQTNYPRTTVYEPTAPQCNDASYQQHATFQLFRGNTYTYKATCTTRQWTGTIVVPCEQLQCKNILLE